MEWQDIQAQKTALNIWTIAGLITQTPQKDTTLDDGGIADLIRRNQCQTPHRKPEK